MQPTDDSLLLRQYVEDHSDEAFAALVTRHINLVYSVALRCVGDPHQAEEVAQAVFILLAKKAGQLRHEKALSSWLFQSTRFTASNYIRGETRRHRREQEAHMQSVLNEPGNDIWPRIAPLLDDAVAALNEKDRHAIVLRFYEGRNLREVGAVLGASEAAAEKRVSRAVERLREFFAKRGVTVGASGLAIVISANAVQAAPIDMASIAANALHHASTIDGSNLLLPDWMKSRLFQVGLGLVGVLLLSFVAEFVWRSLKDSKQTNVATALPEMETRSIQIGGAIKRTTTRPTAIVAFAFKTTARPGEQVTVTNTRSNYRLTIRPAFEQGKIRIDSSLIEDSAPTTRIVFPTMRATNGEQAIAVQGIYSFEFSPTISGSP